MKATLNNLMAKAQIFYFLFFLTSINIILTFYIIYFLLRFIHYYEFEIMNLIEVNSSLTTVGEDPDHLGDDTLDISIHFMKGDSPTSPLSADSSDSDEDSRSPDSKRARRLFPRALTSTEYKNEKGGLSEFKFNELSREICLGKLTPTKEDRQRMFIEFLKANGVAPESLGERINREQSEIRQNRIKALNDLKSKAISETTSRIINDIINEGVDTVSQEESIRREEMTKLKLIQSKSKLLFGLCLVSGFLFSFLKA